MDSPINIEATLVADIMGIFLILCMIASNRFALKTQIKSNKYILWLIILNLISNTVDMLCPLSDGRNGFVVFFANTVGYLICVTNAITWILLVAKQIKVKLTKFNKIFVGVFAVVAYALILSNIFAPVLFRINEYNVYERVDGLFYIYTASYFVILIDVIALYYIKRRESGGIKFFPIFVFLVPIVTGVTIQTIFFGVSTIGPFMSIAIVTVSMSLQNKLLFRDPLTDLYNRYFLSVLQKELGKQKDKEYTVIMIDVNDFKNINDYYGHDAGDKALVTLADVLVSEVDKNGEAIRYAGDEFIVLLNTDDKAFVYNVVTRIHAALRAHTKDDGTPVLTISEGYSIFNPSERTINDAITEADKHMYIRKQKYYEIQKQE